jgi:cytochrome c-type biogenesis protein CcmH
VRPGKDRMLWIAFAVMTAAAIFAALWPLARSSPARPGGTDVLVYRDQLEEIDRDRSAGLIGEPEAEAARIEVSRRLLAAADVKPPKPLLTDQMWRRRAAAVATLIVLPAVSLGLYVLLGSPNIPSQPAFARLEMPGHPAVGALVSQVEAHLATHPDDGAGWEVIAPVYMRTGRFEDAVMARRKALALNGETPTREADLGEALVAAADGVVTDEAKTLFQRASAGDAHEPKARYFLGLADEQDGKPQAAAAKWRALIEDAPPGAPWLGFVQESLAHVTGEPVPAQSGPSAEDMAAAANMTDAQRSDMIRGMVARLADRLHANGADTDGWLRLVRAYSVLGDRDKAKSAAADARRALADDPDAIKRIDDLVKGLGLEG